MKEHFTHQLKENKVVTQEVLDKVTNKTYTSGREIKPGEIILFAFSESDQNKHELISIHQEELDQYEFVSNATEFIPKIKLK
jgi:hypothetical protein